MWAKRLTMTVSPAQSFAPTTLTVSLHVKPDAENRALRLLPNPATTIAAVEPARWQQRPQTIVVELKSCSRPRRLRGPRSSHRSGPATHVRWCARNVIVIGSAGSHHSERKAMIRIAARRWSGRNTGEVRTRPTHRIEERVEASCDGESAAADFNRGLDYEAPRCPHKRTSAEGESRGPDTAETSDADLQQDLGIALIEMKRRGASPHRRRCGSPCQRSVRSAALSVETISLRNVSRRSHLLSGVRRARRPHEISTQRWRQLAQRRMGSFWLH